MKCSNKCLDCGKSISRVSNRCKSCSNKNRKGTYNRRKTKMSQRDIQKLREENEPNEIICIREINDNIKRIFNNQPLTRPLRTLNNNCEFKKRYNLACELRELKGSIREIVCLCGKKFEGHFLRKYCDDCLKPEVKKREREYNQKPEVKKRAREYNQKPEVKKRVREYYKEYNQKPEVKKRAREYHKEYNQKPEVKKRAREYYQRKKLR